MSSQKNLLVFTERKVELTQTLIEKGHIQLSPEAFKSNDFLILKEIIKEREKEGVIGNYSTIHREGKDYIYLYR